MQDRILTGRKRIAGFVGRSWGTVVKWVHERDFPARKIDGVWEADAGLILDWRTRQIAEAGIRKEAER